MLSLYLFIAEETMGERLSNWLKVILSTVGELGFELGDCGSELLTAMLSASSRTSVKKNFFFVLYLRAGLYISACWVKHIFVETREHDG